MRFNFEIHDNITYFNQLEVGQGFEHKDDLYIKIRSEKDNKALLLCSAEPRGVNYSVVCFNPMTEVELVTIFTTIKNWDGMCDDPEDCTEEYYGE